MESVVIYGQQKSHGETSESTKKKTSIGGDAMFFVPKKQKKTSQAPGFSMVFFFSIGVFHTPKTPRFGWSLAHSLMVKPTISSEVANLGQGDHSWETYPDPNGGALYGKAPKTYIRWVLMGTLLGVAPKCPFHMGNLLKDHGGDYI